jgi:serine/threonine protein kinase
MKRPGNEGVDETRLHRCPECGNELPASLSRKVCPFCLLKLGLEDLDESPEVGEQIGHYRILDTLGAGGMGRVYVAQDLKLKRRVALKVLSDSFTEEPAGLARFRREAQSLAALRHPNVVTVYSVEESDGIHYIVMELVDGETLDTLLTPTGLGLERFLDVACAMSGAVGAAHEQGIIHRDLKPSNVMLDEDGQVKVLDFGLAKSWASLPARLSSGAATEEGTLIGTVPYMSPEQLQSRELDTRSDVFSLGIVLYELATGRHPFECETPAETISAILRDEPPSMGDDHKELPRAQERIVGRCLKKDPDERYASAIELAQDLLELKQEVSPTPRFQDAPAWTRALEWDRLWPVALAVVLAVLIGAVLLRPGRVPPDGAEVIGDGSESPVVEQDTDGQDLVGQESLDAISEGESAAESLVDRSEQLLRDASTLPPEVHATNEKQAEASISTDRLSEYSVRASLFRHTPDGSLLIASGARVAPGDELFMTFESSADLNVYILNEDDLGGVFVLFPLQGVDLENPLPAGSVYRLPGRRRGTDFNWQVSSAGGEEHLLIIASTEPIRQIEQLFEGLAQATLSERDYVVVPETVIAELRGIGGLVETGSYELPSPSGRLFAHVRSIAEEPESVKGVWMRQINLENPL